MGGIDVSLAGLDDEDTNKVSNNFKRMLKINTILCDTLGESALEAKTIAEKINESMVFHKTDFRQHLDPNELHICQCISCGLLPKKVSKEN